MNGALLVAGLGIAVVVVISRALALRTGLPYPVFLVLAGAGASFVPGIPSIHLRPSVVFLGFLPPLVYHAGLVTSPRELRANAVPIGLSAFGLVLATTFAVALVEWAAVPGVRWTSAFVLGAIVAPTDAVAATSVLRRLEGPPHLTVILEGESLVNDGIALSLFSLGIAAAASPTTVGGGVLSFVKIAGGGALFGVAVGWLASRVHRPLTDTPSQIVVSLLVPFVAYLPADALGLSGVLATLSAGLVLGQDPVAELRPAGRIRVTDFWEVAVFLLESALFVLVGLQLRSILSGVSRHSARDVALSSLLAVAVVVVVRVGWQAVLPTVRFRPRERILDTGGVPWRERALLGWSGLRGAISLAAALSIPTTVSGRPFPGRDLLIVATFSVIAVTLVGQGTTLPWLMRRMGLAGSEAERREHALAERRCAEAALRRLDELTAGQRVSVGDADVLRQVYERRLDQARVELGDAERPEGPSMRQVRAELLGAQHGVLRRLHREGEISFAVMRAVRREIDLEEASLGIHER